MKLLLMGPLFLLAVSCSHVENTSKTAGLPFQAELLEEIQQATSRAPASFEWNEKEEKSTRRVYFSALYHQYLSLGQHLHEEPAIASCPQFHHDKLETEAFSIPKFSMYKASHIDQEGKNFFPELVFSRKFSLEDHHRSIREEIEILCEEGVSDNYYKFDNLVTHYASKKSFHFGPLAMKSVLKIPVFANFYLIKMLQGSNAQAFTHPEEKRVIIMTKTHWFEKYVAEASRMRNNFIKNKMVKR